MKLIKRIALTILLTVGSGLYIISCEDRNVSTEIKVDHDRNLDGTVDTTIKRETKID